MYTQKLGALSSDNRIFAWGELVFIVIDPQRIITVKEKKQGER